MRASISGTDRGSTRWLAESSASFRATDSRAFSSCAAATSNTRTWYPPLANICTSVVVVRINPNQPISQRRWYSIALSCVHVASLPLPMLHQSSHFRRWRSSWNPLTWRSTTSKRVVGSDRERCNRNEGDEQNDGMLWFCALITANR
jgi:hypothetical protein